MRSERDWLSETNMMAAVDELRRLISARYPSAMYELVAGDDPDGLYLTATVDVDDPDEVVDVIMDRLLNLQVDKGLPLYVIPIRTPERRAALSRPNDELRGETISARRRSRVASITHRTSR